VREDFFLEQVERRQRRRELVLALGLVVLAFMCGTIGYMLIEGWSFFDSLYMTVITLATIGYGETHPLSDAGRAFTMLLIVVGLGVVTVVLGSAWQAAVENQIFKLFDRRGKVLDLIQSLEGHTIFCGFSRLGRISADELRKKGEKIVVVESNEVRAREADTAGFLVVKGDATLDETLNAAGIKKAGRLISLLPRDSDNLYVILTARESNPSLYIVSRAEDEVGEKRLKRAGVDRIISTYRLAARKLADGLLRPFVTEFFEIAGTGDNGWKIEEIRIPKSSPMCGKTLGDLALRQRANVSVAAIISPEGELQLNPAGDTVLFAESTLLAIGWQSDIKTLEDLVVGL
jgi:voltage-gated potassium channel